MVAERERLGLLLVLAHLEDDPDQAVWHRDYVKHLTGIPAEYFDFADDIARFYAHVYQGENRELARQALTRMIERRTKCGPPRRPR